MFSKLTRTIKCRVCFKSRRTLRDIADPTNFVKIDALKLQIPLFEAFHQITNIRVTDQDIARLICNFCVERLTESLKFRKEVESAHKKIKELYENGRWNDYVPDKREEKIKEEIEPFKVEVKVEPLEVINHDVKDDLPEEESPEEEEPEEMNIGHPEIFTNHNNEQLLLYQISAKRYKRIKTSESTIYKCEVCHIELNSLKGIKLHIHDIHIQKKSYRRFENSSSLWVRRQIFMNKRLICDLCKAQFQSFHKLLRHMKLNHISERPFLCDFQGCLETFKTAISRDAHFRKVHDQSTIVCDICAKDIKKQSIVGHMQTHQTEKKFKCIECDISWGYKRSLDDHMKTVHSNMEIEKFLCKHCGREFNTKISYRMHERRMHTHENCIQCETCKNWYLNEKEHQDHVNVVHKGMKRYQCTICGAQLGRQHHLNRHIQMSHPADFDRMLEKGIVSIRSKKCKYINSSEKNE